mmetsp:Transcript_11303/g.26605  ORF Transcript_11303/g.26605 Transcript_11303/m.26605 type:complete len:211 (-) Transcript_11303:91-723(-)
MSVVCAPINGAAWATITASELPNLPPPALWKTFSMPGPVQQVSGQRLTARFAAKEKAKSWPQNSCKSLSNRNGTAPAKQDANKKRGIAVHFSASGVAAWRMMPKPGEDGGTSVEMQSRAIMSPMKPRKRAGMGAARPQLTKHSAWVRISAAMPLALKAVPPNPMTMKDALSGFAWAHPAMSCARAMPLSLRVSRSSGVKLVSMWEVFTIF